MCVPAGSTIRRKRQRTPKSCSECRKRKLKCDRLRPRCSSCISRNNIECLYDFRKGSGHADFLINSNETSLPKSPKIDGKSNIIAGTVYVDHKNDNGIMIYGPTSSKTFLYKAHPGFAKIYNELWSKFAKDRISWKKENNYSKLRRHELINTYAITDGTLVKKILIDLPPLEAIQDIVTTFFRETDLYRVNETISRDTCMKFLLAFFDFRNDSPAVIEQAIHKFTFSNAGETYEFGIILMICNIVHFKDQVPLSVQHFIILLSGLSDSGEWYIEQVQFLLLRWYYGEIYTSKIDGSHGQSVIDPLAYVAKNLGLHLNIDKMYRQSVDNILCVENLWDWILLADLSSALQIGCKLRVEENVRKDDIYFKDRSSTLNEKLKRFLLVGREILRGLHNNTIFFDPYEHCQKMKTFIKREFPFFSNYSRLPLVSEYPLIEMKLLALSLKILISLYCVRFMILEERSNSLKNNLVQTILLSIKFSTHITSNCYKLDKMKYPEKSHRNSKELPPYCPLSIFLLGGLLEQSLTVFSTIVYYRLTLFEKGISTEYDLQPLPWQLASLDVPSDVSIPLITAFHIYKDLFGIWLEPPYGGLQCVLKRFYVYFRILLLQKACRTILEKVIEYRTQTEEALSRTANKTMIPNDKDNLSLSYDHEFHLDEDSLNAVSDEFWRSFNQNWDELLRVDSKF